MTTSRRRNRLTLDITGESVVDMALLSALSRGAWKRRLRSCTSVVHHGAPESDHRQTSASGRSCLRAAEAERWLHSASLTFGP